MTIEQLRELYKTASEEDKPKIALVGQAVKNNHKYGSKQVGGNGYCYECYLEPARPDRYNCEKCSGGSKSRSVESMIERVKSMQTPKFFQKKVSYGGATVEEAEEIFGH